MNASSKIVQKSAKTVLLFLTASSLVAAELHLSPATNEDYGSGASIRSDLYYPGGIPKIGLFLGYPNALSRKDRAAFRFDISSLLLSVGQIEKIELLFYINRIVGEREEAEIAIEYLQEFSGPLDGTVLSDPNGEEIATVVVRSSDGINAPAGPNGVQPKIEPFRVDVTSAVKQGLETGQSTAVFRMRDTQAESTSNLSLSAAGIVISDGNEVVIPRLLVTTKD